MRRKPGRAGVPRVARRGCGASGCCRVRGAPAGRRRAWRCASRTATASRAPIARSWWRRWPSWTCCPRAISRRWPPQHQPLTRAPDGAVAAAGHPRFPAGAHLRARLTRTADRHGPHPGPVPRAGGAAGRHGRAGQGRPPATGQALPPRRPRGRHDRFLAIQEAYQLLSDPLRRRDWDAAHAPGPVRAGDPAKPRPRGSGGVRRVPGRRGARGRRGRGGTASGRRGGAAGAGSAGPRGVAARQGRASGPGAAWSASDREPASRVDDVERVGGAVVGGLLAARPGPTAAGAAGRGRRGVPAPGPAGAAGAQGRAAGSRGSGTARESARGAGSRGASGGGARGASGGPAAGGAGAPGSATRQRRSGAGGVAPADARAQRSPEDIDVYSRSSGAAWSMAARRYFRKGEAELPKGGAWTYRGTQVVTGAEARKVAAEQAAERRRAARSRGRARAATPPSARPRRDAVRAGREDLLRITRARGHGAPRQAFSHGSAPAGHADPAATLPHGPRRCLLVDRRKDPCAGRPPAVAARHRAPTGLTPTAVAGRPRIRRRLLGLALSPDPAGPRPRSPACVVGPRDPAFDSRDRALERTPGRPGGSTSPVVATMRGSSGVAARLRPSWTRFADGAWMTPNWRAPPEADARSSGRPRSHPARGPSRSPPADRGWAEARPCRPGTAPRAGPRTGGPAGGQLAHPRRDEVRVAVGEPEVGLEDGDQLPVRERARGASSAAAIVVHGHAGLRR